MLAAKLSSLWLLKRICSTSWPSILVQLWFQALSKLLIPQILSLDVEFLRFKSVISLREFQSNEALGAFFECLDKRVFEISWSVLEGCKVLRDSWSLRWGFEVAKLTTNSRGEFQCSTFNQSIRKLGFLRAWYSTIGSLRIPQSLYSGREVNKKLRKQYMCLLLTQASWKGLIFEKC